MRFWGGVAGALVLGIVFGWLGKSLLGGVKSWPSDNELQALLSALEGLPAIAETPRTDTYVNPRFGFQIEYPGHLLFPQGESDNSDGQTFLSKDGSVKLIAYGTNNALEETLEQAFDLHARPVDNGKAPKVVSYKKMQDNWFVVSGYENGSIFYEKSFLVDGQFFNFEISYPESQRAQWDKVAAQINSGFKLPAVE